MRYPVLLLFLTLFSLNISAQNKDAILGKWLTQKKEARVEIYKKGDTYAGKIIWLKEQNKADGKPITDSKNPNTALRNRPILNLELIKNFVYKGDNSWENGEIYDAQSGKTYNSKISMSGNDQLNLRGFVGISLFGRTEIWTRVK